MPDYLQTRYALRDASDRLLVAFWTKQPAHIHEARERLAEALCGGDIDNLVELVERTIDNEMGSNFTTEDLAEAVVYAILDSVSPLPEKE